MSFVNVAPQLVSTAAADAARIGSAINTANTAAAATTQVLAAAQDEVSTAIAALFGSHGQHYQAISAQVAAYQQRFVLALSQARNWALMRLLALRGRRHTHQPSAASFGSDSPGR